MSRHVACVALTASFGLASIHCAGPDDAENAESLGSEIVGGVTDHGHPAVVGVTATLPNALEMCTGTLIAPTVVVTAGHCVVRPAGEAQYSSWTVAFGSAQPAPPEQTRAVKRAIAHPAYDPSTTGRGNDAAILLLSAPVTTVAPMAINRKALTRALVSKPLTVVGFGKNDGQNGTGLGTKRAATVPITDVRDLELSAGMPGRTTCQGDSGGPWLMNMNGVPTIVGLTSYGPTGCTDAGFATRVDRVLDFIEPFLAGASPEPEPEPEPPPAGGGGGTSRSASGQNCCFNGQYFACPDTAACFGGFDVNACINGCNGSFDCTMNCLSRMGEVRPPTSACTKTSPPPNVQCGG
jgi:secreted trypsin-like serine protease